MKNVLLLVNPHSRQGHAKLDEIRSALLNAGFQIVNEPESSSSFAEAIYAHAAEADLALVAGGDGSVNAALPGLLDRNLPLLFLPMGTANNLARTLNLPADIPSSIRMIREGRLRKIDIGLANDIPFVNLIGLGLSTQVNRLVRPQLKKWIGSLAFIATALKVVLRMTPFRAVIVCDGQTHLATTWQITVCNGRNYGAGLTIDEEASLNDKTLHGLSTELEKWWHIFFIWRSFLLGRLKTISDVRCFQGSEITISTRRPMHVDVDGDVKTKTPIKISVLPKALAIFMPAIEAREQKPAASEAQL